MDSGDSSPLQGSQVTLQRRPERDRVPHPAGVSSPQVAQSDLNLFFIYCLWCLVGLADGLVRHRITVRPPKGFRPITIPIALRLRSGGYMPLFLPMKEREGVFPNVSYRSPLWRRYEQQTLLLLVLRRDAHTGHNPHPLSNARPNLSRRILSKPKRLSPSTPQSECRKPVLHHPLHRLCKGHFRLNRFDLL